jgi:hypothetical protein
MDTEDNAPRDLTDPETAVANVLHFAESFVTDWESDDGMDKESRAECEQARHELDAAEPVLKRLAAHTARDARCHKLVELLATMTDPHEADDLDGELNAFAQMIEGAKAIVKQTPSREPENVRRFLDISTGHLQPKTRWMVEEKAVIGPIYDHPDGFGWLVYVPDPQRVAEWEGPDPIPADLIACFDKARELRCDYILFDCDAQPIDGLPLYDDDGNLVDEDGDYVESGEAAYDAQEAINRSC